MGGYLGKTCTSIWPTYPGLGIFALEDTHLYVTLEHKSNHKSLGYICSNSQQYIVCVKIVHFSFMPKIIRILSKDHVP